ncbi:homocysteine S-methyltransferase family protein [Emcibacter sp. SYSU 3D8]|uniref:homocysteine S-methyltransferase family protein n=1 Tax=Emcibacter sp. SYSU 3D8 TaxID=3133969 RepID=UPI0031FE8B37
MATYRNNLPQLSQRLFLSDGGIETTLIFHDHFDLPYFAAFDLLNRDGGADALQAYFERYARLAVEAGAGFILESPTWRASKDWADKLGYSDEALADANRRAIALVQQVRDRLQTPSSPMVISGCIGPRGDGYRPDGMMSVAAAEDYHAVQIGVFAGTEADMITAITMTYPEEATGLARAAKAAGMPVALSFTVETDGTLPSGHSIGEAIGIVEDQTGGAPAYYMLNCAHPTHFRHALETGEGWTAKLRGLRANASTRSHAELDEATDLDDGDPADLARRYADLRTLLPQLNVLGGCCGTDHRHVEQIGLACRAALAA